MVDHGIPWSSDHQFRLGVEKVVNRPPYKIKGKHMIVRLSLLRKTILNSEY